MSADKDRGIRRQKQKRAKESKKQDRQAVADAPQVLRTSPARAPLAKTES